MRDIRADTVAAIKASIATYREVGKIPPKHLFDLLSQEGEDPGFEHAAADPLPEKSVARRPGRPRKTVPNADIPPGS